MTGRAEVAPEARWQIWYRELFDRECPRQVVAEVHACLVLSGETSEAIFVAARDAEGRADLVRRPAQVTGSSGCAEEGDDHGGV